MENLLSKTAAKNKAVEQLIKTLHKILNSDTDDFNDVVIAMEAVALHHGVTWKDKTELLLEAMGEPNYRLLSADLHRYPSMEERFADLSNTVGMAKNYNDFATLAEECFNFQTINFK